MFFSVLLMFIPNYSGRKRSQAVTIQHSETISSVLRNPAVAPRSVIWKRAGQQNTYFQRATGKGQKVAYLLNIFSVILNKPLQYFSTAK
jgi:hypothetical protein